MVSEALPIPGSADLLFFLADGILAWGFVILWLDLTWDIFPSSNNGRVSKVHLKNTICPSSRVRFDDASFPLCGLRRQKSRNGLESWKWRSFELLPPARELCRSISPPWVTKGLSSHFCGIVEYPFLCTRKMKGLSISVWSGGSSSYWESFIPFFFLITLVTLMKMLIIISIVISTNSLTAYVDLKCVISNQFSYIMILLKQNIIAMNLVISVVLKQCHIFR